VIIATGPGPRWLRRGLAVVAGLYYLALLKHPPQVSILRPIAFFTESTCLFPNASVYSIEYRLEAWSCGRRRWEPLDPRAYFPIEADDKESRFQRLGYFYQHNTTVHRALDEWIAARHDTAPDAVDGPIGGLRFYKWVKPLPEPGTEIERYVYRPLERPPTKERRELFYTRPEERKARCGM
jgi:hypothetical protein